MYISSHYGMFHGISRKWFPREICSWIILILIVFLLFDVKLSSTALNHVPSVLLVCNLMTYTVCHSLFTVIIMFSLSGPVAPAEFFLYTLHDAKFPTSSQSTSWQLSVKSKCYEHNSCVRLGVVIPWGYVEPRKSSHHIHHMPNMSAMVAPRNMFGWDTYFDLEVICTAHIGG